MPPAVWESKRKERLQDYLKKMLSHPDSKYILLEKLCDLDRRTLNGDHITSSKVVEELFGQCDHVSICCSHNLMIP